MSTRTRILGDSTGRWVVLLLVLGFVLRVASSYLYWRWFDGQFPSTWAHSRIELSQDGTQYIMQADPGTWASVQFQDWRERAYFRPPLASYYFVGLFELFGFNRLAVSTVQALAATLAYLLIYLCAARLLSRRIGLVALGIVAVHPLLMFYDTSFEDSTPALLLTAGALYLTLWAREKGGWRWFAPGAAAGLAVLARPNLLLVAVALGIASYAWSSRHRLKSCVTFAVPVLYLVGITTWHNHATDGRWSLVTDTTGRNLYWGNNPFPGHMLDIQGYWGIFEVDQMNPASTLVEGLRVRTGLRSTDASFGKAAFDYVVSRPGRAAIGFLRKAWRHLSDYEIPRNRNFAEIRRSNPIWRLPLIPYSLLLALALLGGWAAGRRAAFILLLPFAASALTEIVFFNASRYRALGIPFLLPLAVFGAWRVMEAIRARRWQYLVPASLVIAVSVIVGETAVSAAERQKRMAVDRFKAAMMESYVGEDGRWHRFSEERFRGRLAEARRLDPDNLDAFSVEQKLLIGEGKLSDAARNVGWRRARCRQDEWLCDNVCSQLSFAIAMSSSPATPENR